MSMNWTFYSFDIGRWNKVFGGGDPKAQAAIVAAATGDDYVIDDDGKKDPNPPDSDPRVRLARQVVRSGIDYSQLTMEDAEVVDGIICSCFHGVDVDPIYKLLGITPETRNYVNNRAIPHMRRYAQLGHGRYGQRVGTIGKLLGRKEVTAPEHFLDFLCVGPEAPGRRFKTTEPVRGPSPYFILSPDEVAKYAAQFEQLARASDNWPDKDIIDVARVDIGSVLNGVLKKGRWFAACYG